VPPTSPRRRLVAACFAVATLVLVLAASAASASPLASTSTSSRGGFAFTARDVRGAPAGAVSFAGGGAFDGAGTFAHGGGAFTCTESVGQGPLVGCLAGQGVRWHTDTALPSSAFRCAGDALKTATAADDTAVFRATFFRAGDGNAPSFTANVIVAGHDIAPDLDGMQNVWIQGVGCANAATRLGR
jgi:hypothetical protein